MTRDRFSLTAHVFHSKGSASGSSVLLAGGRLHLSIHPSIHLSICVCVYVYVRYQVGGLYRKKTVPEVLRTRPVHGSTWLPNNAIVWTRADARCTISVIFKPFCTLLAEPISSGWFPVFSTKHTVSYLILIFTQHTEKVLLHFACRFSYGLFLDFPFHLRNNYSIPLWSVVHVFILGVLMQGIAMVPNGRSRAVFQFLSKMYVCTFLLPHFSTNSRGLMHFGIQ